MDYEGFKADAEKHGMTGADAMREFEKAFSAMQAGLKQLAKMRKKLRREGVPESAMPPLTPSDALELGDPAFLRYVEEQVGSAPLEPHEMFRLYGEWKASQN